MAPQNKLMRVYLRDISAIKKFELLAQQRKDVISLVQGVPSFFTAQHIKKAAKWAIERNLSDKYTPGFGIEKLRQALVQKLREYNHIKVASSQIIVTHGATEALMAIFFTLFDPQDEVIILSPGYATHLTQTQLALQGKKATFVPLAETVNGWVLDPQLLERKINKRTKAIVFSNPCNPTGKVFTHDELKQLARIAVKHHLYIISDEIYEYFIFDGKKHISIGSFKEVADRTISVFGVSKTYAMTGWRIGYVVASQKLIDEIYKVHDNLITCPTAVSQYAALAAVKGPQNIVDKYRQAFAKRRQIAVEELSKTSKLQFVQPEAAYYIFPKITKTVDDYKLAMKLLNEAKVAVAPGSAFGQGGENHLRICFGGEEETLKEGLQRLVRYLNTKPTLSDLI